MKKRLLTLMLLPAMLLCSCNGMKIEEDKAKEIAAAIKENVDNLENEKKNNVNIKMTYKEAKGQGDLKIVTDATYKVITNAEGASRYEAKGKDANVSEDFVIITKKDTTHEELTYIKTYNETSQKYDEFVYSKVQTANYSSYKNEYSTRMIGPLLIAAFLMYPESIMPKEDDPETEVEDGVTYKNSYNYYSWGDKSLTVVYEKKAISEAPNDTEVEISTKYNVKYRNLLVKTIRADGTSNYGNKTAIKADFKFSTSLYAIDLPNNWQSLLVL